MNDPLGFVSGVGGIRGAQSAARAAQPAAGEQGPSFVDALRQEIAKVNEKQSEADRAIIDLQTGERGDVENVLLAAQEADHAFRLLQATRNKIIEAYQELRDVRV